MLVAQDCVSFMNKGFSKLEDDGELAPEYWISWVEEPIDYVSAINMRHSALRSIHGTM